MKRIAVTYLNGEIFQHFGRCEAFKMFDVENNTVVKSEIVSTNGQGHGAIAGFLKEQGVNAVLCGGMGQGMLNALNAAGITIFGGNSGNVDDALNALLSGKLLQQAGSCDHHDHEHEEGHDCECHCH